MPTMSACEFITKAIKKKGLSQVAMAQDLGVKYVTLRSWIGRGKIPEAKAKQFASMLGVTVQALEEHGVQYTIPNVRTSASESNEVGSSADISVMPLVKAVAAAHVSDLSLRQFLKLAKIQHGLSKELSPTLVKELIAHLD